MPNDPTSLSPQPLTEDEREHMNLLLTPQLRKIATGEHDASDAQRELARLLVAERERDSLARRCERYFRDLEQARTELSRLRAENTAQAARLDEQRGATRVAAAAADRFRDVLSEALGYPDENPGDDVLVTELREHFGFSGPEPTRWRDFLTGARAQIDQIEADHAALGLDHSGEGQTNGNA